MFGASKGRSKSEAQVRRRIYNKIRQDQQEDKWFIFLNQELGLEVVIHELSKAQFDHNNLNKFKYAARSILIMKKDIIYQLEQSQVVAALDTLNTLTHKVSDYEGKKFRMMMILLQCKLAIEKGLSPQREEELISWLKTEMSQYGHQYDSFIIKVAVLTVLSMLLIRNHGILMLSDEKLLIFRTIELKKKMASSQYVQASLECLIYLLSEIYKIIYLLKKDQETILSYYNQLSAYAEAYDPKGRNSSTLDIRQVQSILANMKPMLTQVNIYEDSQIRKQFAFSNLKNTILDQHDKSKKLENSSSVNGKKQSRKSSLKVISASNLLKINRPAFISTYDKADHHTANDPSSKKQDTNLNINCNKKGDDIDTSNNKNSSQKRDMFNCSKKSITLNLSSSIKKGHNLNLSSSKKGDDVIDLNGVKRSENGRKLTLLNYKSEALYRSSNLIEKITEGIMFLSQFQNEEKVIDFLTIRRQKLYLIILKLNFRNSCSVLDIQVHIRSNTHQSQIYALKGIPVLTKQFTSKKISRFIEKLFFFLFKNEGYLLELNHIEMAEEFVPQKLATEDILVSIIRIKALLKHYIKTKTPYHSLIPNKFLFPHTTLQQIHNRFFEEQNGNQQLLIKKRQGQIIKEYSHVDMNNEIILKILYKIQHELSNCYVFFRVHYIYQFKGITIYLFCSKDEGPEVLHLAKQLQAVWYASERDINKKLKKRILGQVQRERTKIEHIVQTSASFSLQLQIMLSSSHTKPQVVQLHLYNDSRMSRKQKVKQRKEHEMIKINKGYFLFQKLVLEHYMIYSNSKWQVTLPLNWKQLGWEITTTKVRMYRAVKIVKRHGNVDLLILASFKADQIVFQYRQIFLKMVSHRVIRKQKGYCLLLQYITPQLQYLYEVIVNPLNRFFCLSEERKPNLTYFNQQCYINNDKQFKYYHLGREKLSEANHYYQNFIKSNSQ